MSIADSSTAILQGVSDILDAIPPAFIHFPLIPAQTVTTGPAGRPVSLDPIAGNPMMGKIRETAFAALDAIMMDFRVWEESCPFYSGAPGKPFFRGALWSFHSDRVKRGIETLKMAKARGESGFWMFYNMGCVLLWKGWTIGFDVVGGVSRFDWTWPAPESFPEAMADVLDCLAVSHYMDWNSKHPGCAWHHVDHYWDELVRLMVESGRKVILPAGLKGRIGLPENRIQWANHEQKIEIESSDFVANLNCHATIHVYQDNPFETPHMMYWMDLPCSEQGKYIRNGIFRFLFGGDTDYTRIETIPADLEPDLAILHFGGINPAYENPDNGDYLAIARGAGHLRARRIIAGHLVEMGHAVGGGRESYSQTFRAARMGMMAGIPMEIMVMAWGEHILL
ncbi:MAG: hypothetical protein CVV64_14830 [Candidatus Wallbacteria bacterium HGW-Wallbacteria-1]|jgi:hypothetical protein|uniref:Uncharacterized protein n=1 Tax=Candidatus Wallbacteria bacterium HGW-Wallbacteria-1 TaxID=2013854 RepID=A0A2N1PLX5_9BACT|nr:MAG: hypothetical protein CVV64_14830 [Candidatus Wallbacteria bacterium HGW-Wallbacteria-1]